MKKAYQKKHLKKKRRSPLRTILFLLLLLVLIILIFLGIAFVKLGNIQTASLDETQLVTVSEDANMQNYTNYALFGIDSQTGSMSDTGNRSDSIIVVSVNNKTKDVKLLSIYRDTFVSINGQYNKINAAYSGAVRFLPSALLTEILI